MNLKEIWMNDESKAAEEGQLLIVRKSHLIKAGESYIVEPLDTTLKPLPPSLRFPEVGSLERIEYLGRLMKEAFEFPMINNPPKDPGENN